MHIRLYMSEKMPNQYLLRTRLYRAGEQDGSVNKWSITMPSKAEKKRRQALVKEIADKAFGKEVRQMPISKENLKELFDFLDRPNPSACDHTLKETIEFLNKRGLDKNLIIPWLNEHGGYCDCEVIYNVDEKWGEFVGR